MDVDGIIYNGTDGTIDFQLDESEKHELEQNNFASDPDHHIQVYFRNEERK